MSIMLVSLESVKAFLEIEDTVTTYDELLLELIAFVSDRIQEFLNRKLKKEERTQYFNGNTKKLFLQAYPIDTTATLTVMVDGTVKEKDTDYYVWEDVGIIEFVNRIPETNPKQVVVNYYGGYPYTTVGTGKDYIYGIPDAIKYATLLQVAYMFRRRRDVGLSAVSLPDGSVSVQNPSELLPEVKSILKLYRKPAGD